MRSTVRDIVGELYYLLMHNKKKQLKEYIHVYCLCKSELFHVFRALCAIEPALLRKFFEIGFAKDSNMQEAFKRAAPVALRIDPMLRVALTAIAKKNKWAKPVAIRTVVDEDLLNHRDAGGTVHMQPLLPAAQSTHITFSGISFGVSSTGKTVASPLGLQLHIADGNVLHIRSSKNSYQVHIRRFECGKVIKCECDAKHPIIVNVQHGDVIAISRLTSSCPSFLEENAYCASLEGNVRFERLKSFCYAAKDNRVSFLAIVQTDGFAANQKEQVLASAQATTRLEERWRERAGSNAKMDGQDALQPS